MFGTGTTVTVLGVNGIAGAFLSIAGSFVEPPSAAPAPHVPLLATSAVWRLPRRC